VFDHITSKPIRGDIYAVSRFASAEVKHVIALYAVPTFSYGAHGIRAYRVPNPFRSLFVDSEFIAYFKNGMH
jgi:hypothetical protein